MSTTPEATVEQTAEEAAEAKTMSYNEQMKYEALVRKATKAHEWRVQVWAQSERKVRQINAQLVEMGAPPYEPYEPDFTDDKSVEHYATMALPK